MSIETPETDEPENTPENEGVDAGEAAAAPDSVDEGEASAEVVDINPLAAQLAEVEAERDAMKDQILRALAETENVRKRANRQISEERVYAVERFARDLLNVSDNLARALDALPEDARQELSDTGRTLLEGVELTQKELHAVMARHGVSAIDAGPGATFDPNHHQAVSQIPCDQPAGSVAQTFQTGWKIGDRTLRAAMVAVSAGSPTAAPAGAGDAGADDSE